MGKGDFRPKNSFESLNCAIEGVIYAVRTQKHIRYHIAMTIMALLLGVILDLPTLEFSLLILSFIILIFAEMLNTAIEITIDMIVKEYHPLAKAAKDVAAGATLISSFGIFIMCYVIFIGYLHEPLAITLGKVKEFTGHLFAILSSLTL